MKTKKYDFKLFYANGITSNVEIETDDIVEFVSQFISKGWSNIINYGVCINMNNVLYFKYKEL